MDRLIASNSVPLAQADTAPATGTPQYATDGNPATNVPATQWPAYAFNALQDEIYNVIIAAGLTPNRNAWNQLLAAIETMLQGSTTNVGVDTGAANAYVVAFTPALSAPVPWVPFWFEVAHTNTGVSTLNATGTVEPLVGGAHLALQGGEMVAKGNALVYWNPTLNSNAGAYVLLFCSGAAEQIAPATASQHAVQLQQMAGIVGAGRNVKARVPTASNTLTITADEFPVKSALGGPATMLTSFNQTVNTTTTGIGGVVGGALTSGGFAAVYAAWGPTVGAGAFIANGNATVPEVFAGTLPSGYTESGLISIAPLSALQFAQMTQKSRTIRIIQALALSGGGSTPSLTSLSIASFVPLNAVNAYGWMAQSGSTTAAGAISVASNASNMGSNLCDGALGVAASLSIGSIWQAMLDTAQTIFYSGTATAGTPSNAIAVTGYDF